MDGDDLFAAFEDDEQSTVRPAEAEGDKEVATE